MSAFTSSVPRKYFSLMPHMDDDDLDPYEYRLLGHYRRVCGEESSGYCNESAETTAKKTRMSSGMVSQVRRRLAQLGRIKLTQKGKSIFVTVCNYWAENITRYEQRNPSQDEATDASTLHEVKDDASILHEVKDDASTLHEVKDTLHDMKQRRTSEEEPILDKKPSKLKEPEKTVEQFETKTEITPAQVLDALTKIDVRIPPWLDEKNLELKIRGYGGDLIMEAIEQVKRQYRRRDWNTFEYKIEELSKMNWKKGR